MRRLVRLPHRLLVAAEATVELAFASVRIGRTSEQRLITLLGDPHPADASRVGAEVLSEQQRADIVRARMVGRVVTKVAAVVPWHPTCLRQSLATRRMVSRRKVAATIHLGVADVATMDAHAWVTVHGWTVVGRRARQFTPVASFPPVG